MSTDGEKMSAMEHAMRQAVITNRDLHLRLSASEEKVRVLREALEAVNDWCSVTSEPARLARQALEETK